MEAQTTLRQKKVAAPSLGKVLLRALFFSLVLMLVLLLAGASLAYTSDNPTAFIPPVSYGSALFVAFFCGFICARQRKRQGLFCGLLSGVGIVCLFLVGLLVFAGDGELDALSLLLFYPILFLLAVCGGIIGGMQKVSGRKRRRR